jgi:VWFA-related protein
MASFILKQKGADARHSHCTGMRILIAFALTAALACLQNGSPLNAAQQNSQQQQQQQQQQKPEDLGDSIKVDVDVVNILASVRDKRGALIPTLEKQDFTVLEDGKPQSIKYFTRETDLPLTIGLLVDTSGSQQNLIGIEKNAASQFFSQVLRKKDEAFLMMFGEESELLQDYTNSIPLLNDGLSRLRLSVPVGGLGPGPVPTVGQPRGTVLYDAVYLAASEKLHQEVGRKVIVVITDGVDEGSKLPIEQAIEAAQKADAVVYSIEYVDRAFYGPFGGFGSSGDGALHRMSDPTGGHVYRVDHTHPLDEVFRELQEEMRTQYAIGYTPTNPAKDGSYRKLDIKTNNKDYKVAARKGYYAIPHDAQ